MKVILGLGNPGSEYHHTRHNVGWWLMERLLEEWRFDRPKRNGAAQQSKGRIADQDVLLLKPLTYMNRSGAALLPLLREPGFNPTTDLLVLVDDTALPVGRLRFRERGSPGGHNGLKSIQQALQSQEYARLRIGIGEKPPGADLADYVLSDFDPEDEKIVLEALPAAATGVRTWVEQGPIAAMNLLNK